MRLLTCEAKIGLGAIGGGGGGGGGLRAPSSVAVPSLLRVRDSSSRSLEKSARACTPTDSSLPSMLYLGGSFLSIGCNAIGLKIRAWSMDPQGDPLG